MNKLRVIVTKYKNALSNANGGSVGMKIRNENGEFITVEDSKKREAYMKTLSSRLDDAQISTTVDPITGKLLQDYFMFLN